MQNRRALVDLNVDFDKKKKKKNYLVWKLYYIIGIIIFCCWGNLRYGYHKNYYW